MHSDTGDDMNDEYLESLKPSSTRFHSSIYRGVSWNKLSNGWMVQYKREQVGHYVGIFHDEVSAAKAYDISVMKHFYDNPNTEIPVFNFGIPDPEEQIAPRKSTHKRRSARSLYRGVSWFSRSRKWRVHVTVKGKKTYIGTYEYEEDAAIAYNAATKRFGIPKTNTYISDTKTRYPRNLEPEPSRPQEEDTNKQQYENNLYEENERLAQRGLGFDHDESIQDDRYTGVYLEL